ncbi:YraN family protein [Glaciimonas sp. PCH181]|uniref:YraN family protein n=1 Tax=Glaciimonas sp. PCH181 TaxID=2133943 RepID=UPI000D3A2152|nr:YraN family protein [Glaciimonas sp. PCH181]PUA18124.1 YraN family protein [Glaciimonas sp. PCH181]
MKIFNALPFRSLLPERRSARQISGQLAEDAALDYLQQRKLKLVERNFGCKGGEIDLIMLDNTGVTDASASLVFVEVRQRANQRHGGAAASVTPTKQRRLIIAAQHFLRRYRQPPACRFDVIAIDGDVTEWIKNAFDA